MLRTGGMKGGRAGLVVLNALSMVFGLLLLLLPFGDPSEKSNLARMGSKKRVFWCTIVLSQLLLRPR